MSETRWIWQYEREIPSDPMTGRLLLEDVLGQLEAHRWPERDRFSIHLGG